MLSDAFRRGLLFGEIRQYASQLTKSQPVGSPFISLEMLEELQKSSTEDLIALRDELCNIVRSSGGIK